MATPEVNRLSMHDEAHGTGAPMALMLGALGTIGSRFQQLLPTSQLTASDRRRAARRRLARDGTSGCRPPHPPQGQNPVNRTVRLDPDRALSCVNRVKFALWRSGAHATALTRSVTNPGRAHLDRRPSPRAAGTRPGPGGFR